MSVKVTKIKADAVVSIQIGTEFLQKLQKVMVQLIADKSTEDLDELKVAIEEFEKNKQELPEDWMENLYTITLLVREIESALIKDGHTYEEELDEDDFIIPQES
jgi:hypothetical protein